MDKRRTKIDSGIIPEEPNTNKIYQQIGNSWDDQVMPKNDTNQETIIKNRPTETHVYMKRVQMMK